MKSPALSLNHVEKDKVWWNDRSNLDRWQLKVCEGRQTWCYHEEGDFRSSFVDKYHLGRLTEKDITKAGYLKHISRSSRDSFHDQIKWTALAGVEFYRHTQTEDGHFAGGYSGPMFLIPGFVIVMYITRTLERVISIEHRKELVHYLKSHIISEIEETPQIHSSHTKVEENSEGITPAGWGLHIEGRPTMFGTCLNYVTLRLLGVPSQEPFMRRAQAFIRKHGGAEYIPSWGKFYLAILNVYEWEGVAPLLPELWILPEWLPIHPSKMWCHSRQVYLPMSYIYAQKFKAPLDPLLISLRQEIYCRPYREIDWSTCSLRVCPLDSYTPINRAYKLAFSLSKFFERWLQFGILRRMALGRLMSHIKAEDFHTKCIGIGPVSKILDMLAIYYCEGPNSEIFKNHIYRLPDYLWLGPDGLKVQGTNGSQVWDTAFFVQAVHENRKIFLC